MSKINRELSENESKTKFELSRSYASKLTKSSKAKIESRERHHEPKAKCDWKQRTAEANNA